MVVVQETRHRSSLNFANERKVVTLRKQGMKWCDIVDEVVNLEGERPSEWLVRKVYKIFKARKGRCTYNYHKCGRKPYKVTPAVRKFVVSKLRELRNKSIVTSTTLQTEVARKFKVQIETSTIRKILKKAGYRWLVRAQKKFSKDQIKARLRFAKHVVSLSKKQLRERLSLSMDGIIITIPPKNDIDRENFCHYGNTHMWRKPSERAVPELAGEDPYATQVPLNRAVPLWGGISEGGSPQALSTRTASFHINLKGFGVHSGALACLGASNKMLCWLSGLAGCQLVACRRLLVAGCSLCSAVWR